jgi:K+-sensing histidine kinase KdpD
MIYRYIEEINTWLSETGIILPVSIGALTKHTADPFHPTSNSRNIFIIYIIIIIIIIISSSSSSSSSISSSIINIRLFSQAFSSWLFS